MHVEEQEMVVSATGEHVHALREARLGERLRVLDDALRVVAETWLARLPKRDRFRGEDVRQRSTRTIGQPLSTASANSDVQRISPPRGPRSVLCVVVVTTCANGTGL